MKLDIVPLDRLSAQQDDLFENNLRILLQENFDPSQFNPIPVVEYCGKFLICDGHHRAAVLTLAARAGYGIKEAPVRILRNNEDMAVFCAFAMDRIRPYTHKEFIQRAIGRRKKALPEDVTKLPLIFSSTRLGALYSRGQLSTLGYSVAGNVVDSPNERYFIGQLPPSTVLQRIYTSS